MPVQTLRQWCSADRDEIEQILGARVRLHSPHSMRTTSWNAGWGCPISIVQNDEFHYVRSCECKKSEIYDEVDVRKSAGLMEWMPSVVSLISSSLDHCGWKDINDTWLLKTPAAIVV